MLGFAFTDRLLANTDAALMTADRILYDPRTAAADDVADAVRDKGGACDSGTDVADGFCQRRDREQVPARPT